jgi:hypothetical protein
MSYTNLGAIFSNLGTYKYVPELACKPDCDKNPNCVGYAVGGDCYNYNVPINTLMTSTWSPGYNSYLKNSAFLPPQKKNWNWNYLSTLFIILIIFIIFYRNKNG